MHETLRTLLAGLVDYAGLFPPANLDMRATAERYANARSGEHEWVLGRLICPASRLDELADAAAGLLPTGDRDEDAPWYVSAIIDGPLDGSLAMIAAFNERHADGPTAVVDAVELKAPDTGFIDSAIEVIPDELFPFFEIPTGVDPRGPIAALAGAEAGAKIRCGGVTPDLIPDLARIAAFLSACVAADVPFKATAGLHHPLRGEHPLTYEPDAPRATMHGFLNVFLTACLIHAHDIDEHTARAVLDAANIDDFIFRDDAIAWFDQRLTLDEIDAARQRLATSFGSCSFDEPVEDLSTLGLL